MSFVAGFFSFQLDIMDSESGNHYHFRIKTPRHPYETIDFFYARMLAFVHAYQQGLSFSQGMYAPDEATIWKKDTVGNILHWIEVGCPDGKKLKHLIRHSEHDQIGTRFSVYFYNQEQITQFCHALRGSKTNWVVNVLFYLIPPEAIQSLIPHQNTSSNWGVTKIEDMLFLAVNDSDLSISITEIDIWAEYQASLL